MQDELPHKQTASRILSAGSFVSLYWTCEENMDSQWDKWHCIFYQRTRNVYILNYSRVNLWSNIPALLYQDSLKSLNFSCPATFHICFCKNDSHVSLSCTLGWLLIVRKEMSKPRGAGPLKPLSKTLESAHRETLSKFKEILKMMQLFYSWLFSERLLLDSLGRRSALAKAPAFKDSLKGSL